MLTTALHRTVSAHSVRIPLFIQNHITGSLASVANYRPMLRTLFSCPIIPEKIVKLDRSRERNFMHHRLILEGTIEAVTTLNIGLAKRRNPRDPDRAKSR
jgi:hypothetical protein